MYDFQNLKVYQASKILSKDILSLSQNLKIRDSWLADQLKRACISITLNIAEGTGRLSKADRRHFYVIAKGSAYECVALLEIFHECKYIQVDSFENLSKRFEEISKMLYGLITSSR